MSQLSRHSGHLAARLGKLKKDWLLVRMLDFEAGVEIVASRLKIIGLEVATTFFFELCTLLF